LLNIDKASLDTLAALLLERAGLKVNADGYYALRLALSSRMPALGISEASEYVGRLKDLAGEHELRALLPFVTVGKTEFFRDSRQFSALERRILPEMLRRARREGRTLNIWSAGCATGEEPYSLAMLLYELGATTPDLNLWATDINMAAIEHAKAGIYSKRHLVGLSPERCIRHFLVGDEGYQVRPEVKRLVRFEGFNLASRVYANVQPQSLDLILCRNVIIYFDLATIRGVMDRFAEALRSSGLLLLGYSESLFKVYERFEMAEVEGSFMYRRGGGQAPGAAEKVRPMPPPELPPRESSEEEYRMMGIRIRRGLAARHASEPAAHRPPSPVLQPPEAPPAASPELAPELVLRRTGEFPTVTGQLRAPTERLASAVQQIETGKFEEALRAIKKLCTDEPNELDALLTLGNLESVLGHLAEAKAAFALALSKEPLCVEARIFSGIASLQAQDFVEAENEFSRALFLEPALALGHYLLAQAQERRGDAEAARRGYRNALTQLKAPQRPLAGHYPDMPQSTDAIGRAARYALAALEEVHAPELS
jgi:chemotaxis protein methyltransferase CheR